MKRRESGMVVILVVVLCIMAILPLGVFAFEFSRLSLAQAQLRAATDSTALAAAVNFSRSLQPEATKIANAKTMGLTFFTKNGVAGKILDHTQLTSCLDDAPASGQAKLDIVYDAAKQTMTATAVFGTDPVFGKFVGLSTAPVRATSTASLGALGGDVAMVLDLSASMAVSSRTMRVVREDSNGIVKHTITATFDNPDVEEPPACFWPRGNANIIPNPEVLHFGQGTLLEALENQPRDVKVAALFEAKAGNLENPRVFRSSGANRSLAGFLRPQEGYQAEYQQLALGATQPLSDEKQAISEFIAMMSNGDAAHLGLISYSKDVSGELDDEEHEDDFSTITRHGLPRINLTRNEDRADDVIRAIAAAPIFNTTNTGGALLEAVDMLTGSGHRPNVEKTILLLTDGLPNTGPDYVEAAEKAGEKGIRILAVGFFHSDKARNRGRRVLNSIVDAAGNGSRVYVAPDIPTLREILRNVGNGRVALVNR